LLLIGGTFFCIFGVYGLMRYPDIYNRLHSAGMVVSLGALGIMSSLLFIGPERAGLKGMATALFLLLTGPLVTHILARTAHRKGISPGAAVRDDLADTEKDRGEG
jgi:multicomponent Na+:H+ antiporter subunit G